MLNTVTLIAAGPCLITVLAAVTLFIVHRSLSPVRHALIWSAAFAATALRWAVLAARTVLGYGLDGGLGYGLLGSVSALLLAEGFRVRGKVDGARYAVPILAALVIPLQILFHMMPRLPLSGAVVPLLSGGLMLWSAAMVVPRERRSSVTELTVIVLLTLLAAIEFCGAALALGDQAGIVHARTVYFALHWLTLEPISAALAMTTLLLIAFDFSAEQQRLIRTDPLTGVLNRLGFEQVAREAMERRRRVRPLSIALADLDGFKGINDRHGHAAGDATLVGFAQHLTSRIDRDEAVGRIGGEEFALLLAGSDGAAALARIEPIRAELAGLTIDGLPDLAVTASFGIAEHQPGEALAGVIGRADEALYRSKREGRNRSSLAPPGPG